MEKRLKLVSVGGTFDVLHIGHKMLLKEAFEVSERVLIGVTSDEFARELHKPHIVDCYEKRLAELKKFLSEHNFLERAIIVPLNDPYGPTIENNDIEGIVVSEETEKRAEEINMLRVKHGYRPLLIFCMKMVLAEDGKPVSSTRIRRQETDRQGRLIG
ncbi:phosphopantetheine adenylyltransferase [Candidatus Bathyarchaeota archaeon]|nr:phosphopantetheine adenylyltransferase [Candidatus Bathyarchaeota archaeon]MBS7631364.1 phosphopantetheine adenylyltransferase [Candidatus Bathyarchaeota archaeon]